MKASKKQARKYQQVVSRRLRRPPLLRNVVLAFVVGGTICTIAELVRAGFVALGMTPITALSPTSAVIIALGALLTGFGVYDEIGQVGGMGAALPISGFANAIVAPAIEFKREGFILGVGARMFTVAGPVLVYGVVTAVAAAAVAWLAGVRAP